MDDQRARYAWRYVRWDDLTPDDDDPCESEVAPDGQSLAMGPSTAPDCVCGALVALGAFVGDARWFKAAHWYEGAVGLGFHEGEMWTAHPFRCWDDDRHGCAVGWLALPAGQTPWDADEKAAFGPLDDYGKGNWGHTHLEYRRNHRWEVI